MTTVPYDYMNQSIQASALIQPRDNDSFYHPDSLGHTGFACDGYWYDAGIKDENKKASWYTEPTQPDWDSRFRSSAQPFPNAGLILLSRSALVILDETDNTLPMWMVFLLQNGSALTDNFNETLIGFTPTAVAYANGILSVTYTPDPGSTIQSILVVSVDFTQDNVYLDVALKTT